MRFLKFPTMVGWSITELCNLRCVYCSQSAGHRHPDELSTEEAITVVDQIGKYRASVIGWTGGEPFMRPDLEELVTRAHRNGLRNVVTTNGSRLHKVAAGFMVKFIKFRISLDAPERELHEMVRGSRTFAGTVDAIRQVRQLGIKVEVVSTIGRHNAEMVEDMLLFLEDIGVPEWSASIFMPTGRAFRDADHCFTPEEYRQVVTRLSDMKPKAKLHLKTDIPQNVLLKSHLLESSCDHYCSAATDLMVIFPDGGIGPCFTVPLTDGNVRDDDLYEVWNNSELLNAFRDKSLLKGNCGDCEYVGSCGGCRSHALAATGDLLMGDPLCWHKPLEDYRKPGGGPEAIGMRQPPLGLERPRWKRGDCESLIAEDS